MTALFFISQTRMPRGGASPSGVVKGTGRDAGRRVDFASLAQLFAEPEEPPPPRADRRPAVRLALLALILLGAVGDVVFVVKPGALSAAAGIARSVQAAGPSALEQA